MKSNSPPTIKGRRSIFFAHKFTLKTKLIFFIVFFISITFGLVFYIINSYQNHLRQYDKIIELITKANRILIVSQRIIDKDFYGAISNLDDERSRKNFIGQMASIQKDLQTLEEQATLDDERLYLETVSRMVESFIAECEKGVDTAITMKEKLASYETANTIYPLISKNLSGYISMQIQNREKLIADLKRATDWIHLFSITSVGSILFAALLFGIFYTGRISASIHEDLQKQKRQMLKIYTENLERMVEVRTRQIESSNKELQTFAYAASHDLQEPLRKILSFGDRLKVIASSSMNEQGKDYLARMINAATRMKDLINGLLQFSRIGATPQQFERVDLAKITQEVLSDMEVRIQELQATIEVNELPVIDANPLQLRQLIQNLVSNALKYQPPGNKPEIVISSIIRPSGKGFSFEDVCELSIKDNGIGIEEKYYNKLFQVFQRLHTRNEYEGTGVGLAICKKIIDCHKGSCVIKSELGNGATFIVTLPVKQFEEQPLAKPPF